VSGVLADGATHSFRVVPVGVNGNQGTLVSYSSLMVRYPDVPRARFAYDAGDGTVTITAA
jgi:hypothetical protein